MALNVASAGEVEGLFKGNNLSKWLHIGEHNTELQRTWKCLIVSLKCLLLAPRGPAGLVAFGSLLAEPHLPDNLSATCLSWKAALWRWFLKQMQQAPLRFHFYARASNGNKASQKCHGDKYFPKCYHWAELALFFLFFSSPHKDLILPCLKFQGDYVA